MELARIVQPAVESSRPLIEANQHDLTVKLSHQPIYVDADVARLAQVISNLLNNAAKYTEQGGQITLSVERHGDRALIAGARHGRGNPGAHAAQSIRDVHPG